MSARPYLRPCRKGFTLIEMMVTLAILAIMLAFAAPSFTSFRRNSEMVSTTNNFVAALTAARSEAMKRNMYAMVIPLNNDNNWSAGWIAFVDVKPDNVFNASDDIEVYRQPAAPSYFTFNGNNSFAAAQSHVRFDGSGFSRPLGDLQNATLSITRSDSSDPSQTRRIKISLTGRVRVCTPASSSDSSCSGTGD